MLTKIFNSQDYLSANKKDCFEGWYFRHAGDFPFSFIAGVSKRRGDEHSFIQYIDRENSYFFKFPLDAFAFSKENMSIKIENNTFSLKGINVNIFNKINLFNNENNEKINIVCNVQYESEILYKKSLFSPSVMGPFSYLPMPCSHAVISLSHAARGTLNKNGAEYDINATGYIEKDYGRKFPQNYAWIHAANKDTSIAAAAACPVVLGKRGFFCLINHKGKQYNLSLYKFARLKLIKDIDSVSLLFKNGGSRLEITATQSNYKQKLLAPTKGGGMTREIYEDLWSAFRGSLVLDGKEVDISDITHCAFETAGNVF